MAKDFTKKTFSKILRGYAPEEVESYIAYINEEYRKLERRSAENERKLTLALKKLDEAQKNANSAEGNSTAESERAAAVLREATEKAAEKAEQILAAANAEAEMIRSDAAARAKLEADGVHKAASLMYCEVCSFRDSLFELYNDHIESIESMTETAKAYIDKADSTYSEATGAVISRGVSDDDSDPENDPDYDPVNDEYDDDGDVLSFNDEDDDVASDDVEDNTVTDVVAEDDTIVEIDVTDEKPSARDVYIDLLDEDTDDDLLSFDDPDALQIDWKNRRAVVNTNESDEAEEADEDVDDSETRVLDLRTIREAARGIADEAEEDPAEDDSDFDESGDASVVREFGNLDFLFSKEKIGNDGNADEFDIVFAGSDVNKEIDEIRRQPTIVPNEPKNKKKHSKF